MVILIWSYLIALKINPSNSLFQLIITARRLGQIQWKRPFNHCNRNVQWSNRQQRMSALTTQQSWERAEGMKLALLLKPAVPTHASELLRLNLWKLNFKVHIRFTVWHRTARVRDAKKMWRGVYCVFIVRFWQQLRVLYRLYISLP